MKKRNLKALKLNKKPISNFTTNVIGGAQSGLEISCRPALCLVTKEGLICEPASVENPFSF